MDLAVGARAVWVIMEHTTRKGGPRLVEACTLPLTGKSCVTRVYTDLAVVEVTPAGFLVRDMLEGMRALGAAGAHRRAAHVRAGLPALRLLPDTEARSGASRVRFAASDTGQPLYDRSRRRSRRRDELHRGQRRRPALRAFRPRRSHRRADPRDGRQPRELGRGGAGAGRRPARAALRHARRRAVGEGAGRSLHRHHGGRPRLAARCARHHAARSRLPASPSAARSRCMRRCACPSASRPPSSAVPPPGLRPTAARLCWPGSSASSARACALPSTNSMANGYPPELRTDAARFAAFRARWLGNDPASYAAIYRMLAGTDLQGELARIACPALVLGGRLDRTRPPALVEPVARRSPAHATSCWKRATTWPSSRPSSLPRRLASFSIRLPFEPCGGLNGVWPPPCCRAHAACHRPIDWRLRSCPTTDVGQSSPSLHQLSCLPLKARASNGRAQHATPPTPPSAWPCRSPRPTAPARARGTSPSPHVCCRWARRRAPGTSCAPHRT